MAKSFLISVIECRCPQCRKGKIFSDPNPYNLKNIGKMNEACPVCGLNLTPEMGFYWGAMYVSYALTVALSFANFVIAYLFFGWLTWEFLIGNAIVLILLLPLIFRISRALWLALFIKYRRQ